METKRVIELLNLQSVDHELYSDKVGVIFADGSFYPYEELPKPSEMLKKLDGDDWADRH